MPYSSTDCMAMALCAMSRVELLPVLFLADGQYREVPGGGEAHRRPPGPRLHPRQVSEGPSLRQCGACVPIEFASHLPIQSACLYSLPETALALPPCTLSLAPAPNCPCPPSPPTQQVGRVRGSPLCPASGEAGTGAERIQDQPHQGAIQGVRLEG